MKKFLPTLTLIFTINLVFCQVYTDYIGAGHSQDFVVTSSDAQSDGLNTVNGNGLDLDILGSSRFLARTTLGYTIEDIQELTEVNLESWIDNEMSVEPSYNTVPTIEIIFQLYNTCLEELGPECMLQFNLSALMWRYSWWNNIMNGEDRLRQSGGQKKRCGGGGCTEDVMI